MQATSTYARDARYAMKVSLIVSAIMLAGKFAAWLLTGSAAILSDFSESLVHVVAVSFAAFSLSLSHRPPDERFHYGYERVAFFSAGFEGALIVAAAIAIVYEAVANWIAGVFPHNLSFGTLIILAASVGNLLLGVFLIRTGKKTKSLVIEAHGRHVLTDSWTSFGVVAGLALALVTGWKPFDPLVAIAVAVNILFSGGKLIRESVRGLMDYSDPEIKSNIESELDALCREYGIGYHHLRYRHTGSRLLIDVHLQFPFATPVGVAHRIATNVEQRLSAAMSDPAEVFTHLEAAEDHDEVHGPNQL